MFKVIVASFDVAFLDRTVAALDGIASVLRSDPRLTTLRESVQRMRPDFVLLDTDAEFGLQVDLAEAVKALIEVDRGHAVVAAGDAGVATTVLAAIRAGARDFIGRDLEVTAMQKLLVESLARAPKRKSEAANLFGVISGQPNDGESLLAINYAVLRASQGRDTLLIDCNLPSTEAAAALDVELRYTLRDAIQDLPRLDRTLLAGSLGRHPASGLHVLPLALAGEDVNDLSPTSVLSLLQVLRGMFAETILNIGGIRHPQLLTDLIQSTSGLYFVTTQKFTSLKACKELLAQLTAAACAPERMTLVIDDYDDSISLTEAQIGQAMGLAKIVRLPAARVALVNALNRGQPLVLAEPRHAYSKALVKLVPPPRARRAGDRRGERKAPGFFGRLVPG